MPQLCRTCDRSWDDRATFCGACGAHLGTDHDATVPVAASRDRGGPSSRWRWALVALVVAVGVGLAVPVVQVERTPPVTGEVGVPDTDDLQAVVADDGGAAADPAPGPVDPPRTVPPPRVSCWRHDSVVELPCVLWVHRVLDPGPSTGLELAMGTGTTLVTVGGGSLRAFDAAGGTQRWERPLARPVDTAALGEQVVVLYHGGQARTFALADGRHLWSADAFTPVYGDTVSDGLVHTGDRDADGPKLVVRDATDGTVAWEARTGGAALASVLATVPAGVLVTTHERELAFLDRETGQLAWRVEQGRQVLDLRDGLVVVADPPARRVGSSAGRARGLQGLSLPDGSERWSRTLQVGAAPLGVQGGLLLAPSPGQLRAVDVTTGEDRWSVPTAEVEQPAVRADAGVEVPGGAVLTVGSESGILRARDPASGETRWEHAPDGDRLRGAYLLSDGLLVVPGADGMAGLDPRTGQELLRLRSGRPLHPVGVGTDLMVDYRSGYAVGFDLPDRDRLVDDA